MAKRKRSEHYVNNKEFLAALIKYREDKEIARIQDKPNIVKLYEPHWEWYEPQNRWYFRFAQPVVGTEDADDAMTSSLFAEAALRESGINTDLGQFADSFVGEKKYKFQTMHMKKVIGA